MGSNLAGLCDKDLRSILENLQNSSENPVVRARKMVELEVPPERRGPGWDRHWRELEAYAGAPGTWPVVGDPR
jgi:hypothetical protein